jgi:crotonobetainyl-CoA:carnitine CoA-transferase CaiB-like acyl-CoA transferase
MTRKPLGDIRVVEVSQLLTGPMAGMHLADLGAEVVKVENPSGGDLVRPIGPEMNGLGVYFSSLNRNKKFISIDLTTGDGRDLLMDIIREADILIENLKRSTVEDLEIDYDSLSAENPNLIYCSIKGFGEESPYQGAPAFDFIIQAMSGTMSVTGEQDGQPLRTNVPIGDIAAAMYAKESILAALYHRTQADEGEHIQISMLDSLVTWLNLRVAESRVTGEPYPRRGNEHENLVPYTTFETNDGYIVIAIASNNLWPKFCKAIERESLVDDDRFATNADRVANKDGLYDVLQPLFKTKSTADWFSLMQEYGVPAAPIYNTLNMWKDPHMKERNLFFEAGAEGQRFPSMRYPVKFQNIQVDDGPDDLLSPKQVGADSEEFLREIGYSEKQIDELSKADII